MNSGGSVPPGPEVPGWGRLFESPHVDRVEIVDDVVRVRLKSGVELEWPLDASSDPDQEWDS